MFTGDEQLRVQDLTLGVGRLGPVGILGEIPPERIDRLRELALLAEDQADLERDGHPQLGQFLLRLVGLGPEGLLGEEGAERLQRTIALTPVQARGADPVGGPDGVLVGGIGVQVASQGGDAEVEARVVPRLGESIGLCDPEEGIGPDVGRAGLVAFQVTGQVDPGQPGRQRLPGLELGLAEVEADGGAVGPFGESIEIGLELRDRPGGVS